MISGGAVSAGGGGGGGRLIPLAARGKSELATSSRSRAFTSDTRETRVGFSNAGDRLRPSQPSSWQPYRCSVSVGSRTDALQAVSALGSDRDLEDAAAALFKAEIARASAEADGRQPEEDSTANEQKEDEEEEDQSDEAQSGDEGEGEADGPAKGMRETSEEGAESGREGEQGETGGKTGASLSSSSGEASPSFTWAQNVMSGLASRLLDLEVGLKGREEAMADSASYISGIKDQGTKQDVRLRQAEQMARQMQLQLKSMQRTVSEKDDALNKLLRRTQVSEKRVEEVERQAARDRETMTRELQAERVRSEVQIESVLKREEGLRLKLKEAQEGIAERDVFLKQLQEEAALSASALKQAAQAMVAARDRTLRIEEQLEMLGDELVKEKDNTAREREKSAQLSADLAEARMSIEELNQRVRDLQLESADKDETLQEQNARLEQSDQELGLTAEALSSAEERIKQLEQLLQEKQDQLRGEAQASASALETAWAREKELEESQETARQLSLEILALKESLESKEKIMQAVREETAKNAELLTSAARTRKDLADARTRIEQLENEMKLLQGQVQEKESFLEDVRADAKNSAEALRTAALIKKELNEAREKEDQLMEEMERREAEIEALKAEVEANPRAQRAELAIKDLTRRATDLESERDALRRGIAKRDEALALMKIELERGTHMLSAAADTREALLEMKREMDFLQREAELKAQRLSALEDEIVGVGQNNGTHLAWLQQQQQQQQKQQQQRIPGNSFDNP